MLNLPFLFSLHSKYRPLVLYEQNNNPPTHALSHPFPSASFFSPLLSNPVALFQLCFPRLLPSSLSGSSLLLCLSLSPRTLLLLSHYFFSFYRPRSMALTFLPHIANSVLLLPLFPAPFAFSWCFISLLSLLLLAVFSFLLTFFLHSDHSSILPRAHSLQLKFFFMSSSSPVYATTCAWRKTTCDCESVK